CARVSGGAYRVSSLDVW
nr:immunoglobulin heavy chain junction region [Macaca mulatta]